MDLNEMKKKTKSPAFQGANPQAFECRERKSFPLRVISQLFVSGFTHTHKHYLTE